MAGRHADEAGQIAREIDHLPSLAVAYRGVGLVSLRRGNHMQAIPLLERAVELAQEHRNGRVLDETTWSPA